MIVLKILEFASENMVNFLVTFLLFSLPAWAIANFRLVEINVQYDNEEQDQLSELKKNKEEN